MNQRATPQPVQRRPDGASRRWRAPIAVRVSIALHVAALAGLVIRPSLWPWFLAALILDHAFLTCIGLWPRSHWLGANLTRLPAAARERRQVAITIDDGPDPELTPQVLDLLDRLDAKVTFFCIGDRAAEQPELCRDMIRRGHSVQNHSQHHRHGFSLLGPRGFEREITAAQSTLADITGVEPTFFRAPAGLRNPMLDPVLHRLGLQLASWTRRGFDTRVHDADRVLARLTAGLSAGDILLLHDGHAARDASGQAVILSVLPALVARCRAAGLEPCTLPVAMT